MNYQMHPPGDRYPEERLRAGGERRIVMHHDDMGGHEALLCLVQTWPRYDEKQMRLCDSRPRPHATLAVISPTGDGQKIRLFRRTADTDQKNGRACPGHAGSGNPAMGRGGVSLFRGYRIWRLVPRDARRRKSPGAPHRQGSGDRDSRS